MNAQQAMDEVLDQVGKITGKPALLHADSSIAVPATVRVARVEAPAHIIRYQPGVESELPYLACFQCGFLIRLYQAPANQRFDLGGTPLGKAEANRLLEEHFRRQDKKLPLPLVRQVGEQILNGLLVQLRSVPIGLRIDSWIYKNYPVLRDQQRVLAVRQLNENAGALKPEVKAFSPPKVYEANISMSAAFGCFWARLLADNLIVAPYQTSGFLSKGQALLRVADEMGEEPANDRALIEAWGVELDLTSWYWFVPPS